MRHYKKKSDWEEILLYKVIKPHVWYCGIKYWDSAPEIMSDPSPRLCGNMDSWICGFCFPAPKQSYTTAQKWKGSWKYLYKIIDTFGGNRVFFLSHARLELCKYYLPFLALLFCARIIKMTIQQLSLQYAMKCH